MTEHTPHSSRSLRPRIGSSLLAVTVALYLLAATNLTFWHKAWAAFATTGGFVSFAIAAVLIFVAVCTALSWRYIAKPFYVFAILAAAGASYFTDTFGTIINANMIENVLATNSGESGEFFTSGLLRHMLLFGLLPSLVILWLRVDYRPIRRQLRRNLVTATASLAIAAGLIGANLAETRAAMRYDFNALMETLNPAGPISSTVKVATALVRQRNALREPVGVDARRGPWITAAVRPVVTVLVVGESARAMNFSLNGYGRDTNPVLSGLPVVSFANVTSCGTETSVSLRCMFSGLYGKDFSKSAADARESLMDVYRRAGIDVLWWDNDGGSKGVADGVSYTSYMLRNDPDRCLAGTCQDDIFLDDLGTLLSTVTRDTVVVLHQRGSHGPAYYLRYPDTFRPFRPDCRNYDMTTCTQKELVNAYDNTIAYNDRFLGRVIALLDKNAARLTGSMFYVSDHGQSLGENGLYMHATPYDRAPWQQKNVPLIVWTDQRYQSLSGLDMGCAKTRAGDALSHANVYHTLLGMMNVETAVYRPELDILGPCRTRPAG